MPDFLFRSLFAGLFHYYQEGDLAQRGGEGQGLRGGLPPHHAPRRVARPGGVPLALHLHAGDSEATSLVSQKKKRSHLPFTLRSDWSLVELPLAVKRFFSGVPRLIVPTVELLELNLFIL
jgi:hypothetical protein